MDNRIAIACMLVAGGAIGLILPSGGDETGSLFDSAPREAPGGEPILALAQQPADNLGWADNVVLERQSDGHFYADVRVDGRSYHMLVDTGATVVALTAEDAAAMGIQWYDEDVVPVAQGANGPVNGIATTIDRMSVGGHEASGVRAIVIVEGAGISLLGQSFLSTIDKVEISGDRMILGT